MCFALFLGADELPPIVPWIEGAPAFNTQELTAHEAAVVNHFSKRHVVYLGADTGCSCGFRSASYQNGEWPEEEFHDPADQRRKEERANHEALVAYLLQCFTRGPQLEFYGQWEGDFPEPPVSTLKISIKRLLDSNFYFRDRCFDLVSTSED